MRTRKYRLVTTVERGSNRLIRLALRAGVAPRAFALLETTGRRTGVPRHTPVGNGLDGDIFWLIAVHGAQADYVRNLQAEPRVRVKAAGVWRSGTAVVLPDDDPAARSRTLPHQWDAAIGRMMASAPLTIRVDLDPAPGRNGPRIAETGPGFLRTDRIRAIGIRGSGRTGEPPDGDVPARRDHVAGRAPGHIQGDEAVTLAFPLPRDGGVYLDWLADPDGPPVGDGRLDVNPRRKDDVRREHPVGTLKQHAWMERVKGPVAGADLLEVAGHGFVAGR